FSFSVSRTASDEIRQNNGGLCGCRGKASFAEAWGMCEQSDCAKLLRTGFCLILQGKGPVW
ncbi:MAG TPA: hypothetical protein VK668_08055, partial [Mucilaginibacter sp.]|nr:hypothetical protein [Mucilaginibacter sp.]